MLIRNVKDQSDAAGYWELMMFEGLYNEYKKMLMQIILLTHYNIYITDIFQKNTLYLTIVYDSITKGPNALLEVEIFVMRPIHKCVGMVRRIFQEVIDDVQHEDDAPYMSIAHVLLDKV